MIGYLQPDTTPPAAPNGLTATAGNTSVALSWTANSEGDLAGYNVYRFDSPSTYTKINGSLLTSPVYTATGLTNGDPYTFVVTAVDTSTNESDYSSSATATPFSDTTPPAIPAGLGAVGGDTNVNLTWTANTDLDLAGYNVYRYVAPSTYTKVNSTLIAQPTHAFNVTGLTNGMSYSYVVTSVDVSTNESDKSTPASAIPSAPDSALQFDGTNDYVTFNVASGLDSRPSRSKLGSIATALVERRWVPELMDLEVEV